jgi:ATP-dependent helicase/nuclease subunit A
MQPTLFDVSGVEPPEDAMPPDQPARDFAVDPANHVVLEASAGTGKTRVLVDRYVGLLAAGVDPRHILAVTFTRKAAAEMRERLVAELGRRADAGRISRDIWRDLSGRLADIQVSTIDAFCFGLLREFPIEAGVSPDFDVADETEMARFAAEAIDLTLAVARGLVDTDEAVRLLFARVRPMALQNALASLLDRRQVALPAIATFVRASTAPPTAAGIAEAFIARLRAIIAASPDRAALADDGPREAPIFRWLRADIDALDHWPVENGARVQQFRRRLERYFLTTNGTPRKRLLADLKPHFASDAARKRHEAAVAGIAGDVELAIRQLDADISRLLARGLLRVVSLAADRYERLLEDHALLDFAGMLDRAVALLERQEEFARSRLKLQARYHHLLVDEFQDTSRRQWRLVELLIDAWGEGEGVADAPTSIFVVGDRKQSIYRFRHAEVTLLGEAARRIAGLRPGRVVRQTISTSFRAVPELLAFVNALASEAQGDGTLPERFSYELADRFPVPAVTDGARRDGEPVLGIVAGPDMPACAAAVAAEVARLIGHAVVRDRSSGARPARPDDIAILFRTRAGHRYFEDALEARGIRTYVYKGLGFFDAPEVQDLQALLRFLAQPDSDLRAAELLRSRFVRLSDDALARIAPHFARALTARGVEEADALDAVDRALLDRARVSVDRWLALGDRIRPSELLDLILRESAYDYEMRGPRLDQARENVKKVRALVRRVENRGYATLGRLAAYFESLRAGDESNAVVQAAGAVNLMTMHAAKGLEFPIVFLVNLHAGGRGGSGAVAVIESGPDGTPEVAFGSTDATRLEERRDAEELRRLLYVAVTRARDRLYLAAEVDERGRLRRAGRSLASLLPPALGDLFARAAADERAEEVEWTSTGGRFAFRVCRADALPPAPGAGLDATSVTQDAAVEPPIEIRPLVAVGRHPVAATSASPDEGGEEIGDDDATAGGDWRERAARSDGHERLVGTLVHRLFQRQPSPDLDLTALSAVARRLCQPQELVDVPSPDDLAANAAALYARFRDRDDVRAVFAAGECWHEVPFSYVPPGQPDAVVRGVVDCLVIAPDGDVTVVELKTGRPRPEHERQAALYARAMAAVLGRMPTDPPVIVRVFYP